MNRTVRARRASRLALTITAALLGAALLPIPTADASAPGDDDAVTASSDDWCGRTAPGPGGTAAPAVDLSAAHNVAREFSVSSTYAVSDQALAGALTGADPFGAGLTGVLQRYDQALDDVCVLKATHDGLDPATVTMAGTVAIVTPGTGDVTLPDDTTVAVVDLRDLPAVDGAGDAVRRAVGATRAHDLAGPARVLRSLFGPRDEWDFAFTSYSTEIRLEAGAAITATGTADRPLVFLTGRRTAPDAAALAGELRLAGQARVLGQDLLARTAEAAQRGVDGRSVAVRTAEMVHETGRSTETLPALVVHQDDKSDPSSASFKRDVDVTDQIQLTFTSDGRDGDDLDMYLLRDANNDGSFSYPDELAGQSLGGTGDEAISLGTPQPGRYQLWMHGYTVAGGVGSFDLTIDEQRGAVWPDVILRDAPLQGRGLRKIAAAATALVATPPGAVTGPAARPGVETVDPFGKGEPVVTSRETLQAALVTAHGMVRRFYPYFDVVGDTIDGRLLETLGTAEGVDPTDRLAAMDVLRRFTEALHDNHAGIADVGPPILAGYLPVLFTDVAGRPGIRRSLVPGMNPGDVVTAVGGRPIEEIIAELEPLESAATPGLKRLGVYYRLNGLQGPTEFTLESPDGVVHTVTAQPESAERFTELNDQPYPRPSGLLDDLGAADLYYLNMSYGLTPTAQGLVDYIAEAVADHATGIVVDMRHYPPEAPAYVVAKHLLAEPALSAFFGVDRFTGPDGARDRQEFQVPFGPLDDPSFTGPIVLLVDTATQSAAESFSQVLVGAHRPVAVIGRNSAGTTGERTSMVLPGGYVMRFTGMHILNPDGSQFHGIGIVPDIPVEVTAADLRDGIDRDVLTAIDVLEGAAV